MCDNLGDSNYELLNHRGLEDRRLDLTRGENPPKHLFYHHHASLAGWMDNIFWLQSDKRRQTWTDYSGFWMLIPQKETRGLRSCSRTCFELSVTTFAQRPMLPSMADKAWRDSSTELKINLLQWIVHSQTTAGAHNGAEEEGRMGEGRHKLSVLL